MKKLYFLLSSLILLTACRQTDSTVEIDVHENTDAYTKTYQQQSIAGETVDSSELELEDSERKDAYNTLQAYKETITEKAILNALAVVDEFYISNNTLQATRKAYGVKSEENIYESMFKEFAKSVKADPNYQLTYKGKKYKLSELGQTLFKVNVNALQESAAYEVVYSKLEDNKVYIHIRTPYVDTYQYYVQATYKQNYQTFFLPIEEKLAGLNVEEDIDEALGLRCLYYTQAVGGAEGYVDLAGMSWGELRDLYLVFDIKNEQIISIDSENLLTLSQVSTGPSTEKWEETFSKWEKESPQKK